MILNPPNNIYHIDWHMDEYEIPKIRLYTTNSDGFRIKPYIIDLPIKPYFLAYADVVDSLSLPSWVEIKQTELRINNRLLYRVNVPAPNSVPKLRDLIGFDNIFEADIPYNRRVMIDLDWRLEIPKKWLFVDIETDPSEGVPNSKEAKKRIISIAAKDNDGVEYFFSHTDENMLFRDFLVVLDKYPIMCTFNGNHFDWPYLINRARRLEIDYDWHGVVHIDLRAVYKFVLLIQRDLYSLEHIALKEELKTQKQKIRISDLMDFFEHDIERLREYNLDDVRIIYELDKKWNMVFILFSLAKITHTNVKDLLKLNKNNKKEFNNSVAVDGLILSISRERNPRIVWPTKKHKESEKGEKKENFQGAMVLDPVPGLHKNVAILDVNALYPTIIMALNIGPETYRTDDSGDIKSPIERGSFISTPKSVFSEGLSYVLTTRNEWRKKKATLTPGTKEYVVADTTYNAYKVLANSIYGVIGSLYGRYFNKDIAENITLTGQKVIMYLRDQLNEQGIHVIAGDTDSVFLQPPDLDVSNAQQMASELTQSTRKYLQGLTGSYPSEFRLDIDKLCSIMYIPGEEKKGTKKKYVARVVWKGQPTSELMIKGFEIIRHDASEAKRNAQKSTIEHILDGYSTQQLLEYADEWYNKLISGELDRQLIVYKSIGKNVDEYEVIPAHVRAAQMLNEQGKILLHRGAKIGFIKTGKKPEEILPVSDDSPISLSKEQYIYIWNNQFVQMFQRLGIPIEEKSDKPKEKTYQLSLSDWM